MAKAVANRKKSKSVTGQVLDAVASLLPRKKATKRRENKNGKSRASAKSKPTMTRYAASSSSKSKKASAPKRASTPSKRTASSKTKSSNSGRSAKRSVTARSMKTAKTAVKAIKSAAYSATHKTSAKAGKNTATPKHTIYADLLEAKRAATKTTPTADAAHAPGHRKLPIAGLKKTRSKVWQNSSVVNNNSADDRIARNESPQRRLLPSSTASKARRGNY